MKGNARLYLGSSNRLRSRVVIEASAFGGGALVFEVWCDTNRARCQGHIEVCAKLFALSDNGLL